MIIGPKFEIFLCAPLRVAQLQSTLNFNRLLCTIIVHFLIHRAQDPIVHAKARKMDIFMLIRVEWYRLLGFGDAGVYKLDTPNRSLRQA